MTAPVPLLCDSTPIDATPQGDGGRLALANRWLEAELNWCLLSHNGTTNRLYRAELAGRRLVLRLNAQAQQAFGVDRQREAALLDAIQGYDWAPVVLHNSTAQGWCLMADHGGCSERVDVAGSIPALLDAISQWQQIDTAVIASCGLSYTALLERYHHALEHRVEPQWHALLQRLSTVYRALPTVRHCLTHHDLHPGNLCFDDACDPPRWVVLDWEYAAVGNPWFDAAALQRQFGIPDARLAALPVWNQLDPDQFQTGLRLALWLHQALECLWWVVRTSDAEVAGLRQQAQRLLAVAVVD